MTVPLLFLHMIRCHCRPISVSVELKMNNNRKDLLFVEALFFANILNKYMHKYPQINVFFHPIFYLHGIKGGPWLSC